MTQWGNFSTADERYEEYKKEKRKAQRRGWFAVIFCLVFTCYNFFQFSVHEGGLRVFYIFFTFIMLGLAYWNYSIMQRIVKRWDDLLLKTGLLIVAERNRKEYL